MPLLLLCLLLPNIALAKEGDGLLMPWSLMALLEWLALTLGVLLMASHKSAAVRWSALLCGLLYIGFRFWTDPINEPLLGQLLKMKLRELRPVYIALTCAQAVSPALIAGLRIKLRRAV